VWMNDISRQIAKIVLAAQIYRLSYRHFAFGAQRISLQRVYRRAYLAVSQFGCAQI